MGSGAIIADKPTLGIIVDSTVQIYGVLRTEVLLLFLNSVLRRSSTTQKYPVICMCLNARGYYRCCIPSPCLISAGVCSTQYIINLAKSSPANY